QVAEQSTAGEVVANEQEGDGEAEDARRRYRSEPQEQRVPEGSPIEAVGGEVDEVADRQPPRIVGERVVEDSGERVDEEDREEEPDRGDAERRPRRTADAGARALLSSRRRHPRARAPWRPRTRCERARPRPAVGGAADRARRP